MIVYITMWSDDPQSGGIIDGVFLKLESAQEYLKILKEEHGSMFAWMLTVEVTTD